MRNVWDMYRRYPVKRRYPPVEPGVMEPVALIGIANKLECLTGHWRGYDELESFFIPWMRTPFR